MPRFKFPVPASSEITPKETFLNRRQLMIGAGSAVLAGSLAAPSFAKALDAKKTDFTAEREITAKKDALSYNNFYEFGTGKDEPARNAQALTTDPWTIKVDGLVNNPGEIDLEELMTGFDLEERIYRLRCVEAWSMVIPWIGFPLADLIKRYDVQGSAKYVAFETLVRPEEMIGQQRQSLNWPYVEGLRLDEAMNPLTLMAVGMYGETMPKQNGAPIRLVVPWKYGFKSIKSIVRISFVEEQPPITWNLQAPNEYGFYSNVNPEVDHPRWSQSSERAIGSGFFAKRVPTMMFNGYGEQVASMYDGMDLKKNF